MAKKQTRRSVSLTASIYRTLRRYCREHEVSMSSVVEQLATKLCEEHGIEDPGPEPPKAWDPETEEIASNHFTF